MPPANNLRDKDEVVRLGREVYARLIEPTLRPEDKDKFIAVDVDTGEYELDASDRAATKRLRDRRPGAWVWLGRVGHPAAYRLGWGPTLRILGARLPVTKPEGKP